MKRIYSGKFEKVVRDDRQVAVRAERRDSNLLLNQNAKRRKRSQGVEHFAGHAVAGKLSDGTRILEPVAQPASFTQKEIHDTVRDVLSRTEFSHRHAD